MKNSCEYYSTLKLCCFSLNFDKDIGVIHTKQCLETRNLTKIKIGLNKDTAFVLQMIGLESSNIELIKN